MCSNRSINFCIILSINAIEETGDYATQVTTITTAGCLEHLSRVMRRGPFERIINHSVKALGYGHPRQINRDNVSFIYRLSTIVRLSICQAKFLPL